MHAEKHANNQPTGTRVTTILEELAAIPKMHTPRALTMA